MVEGEERMYVFREGRYFLFWDADERNVRWYGWISHDDRTQIEKKVRGKDDINVKKRKKKARNLYRNEGIIHDKYFGSLRKRG